jgi:hypothetical protein
MFSLMSLPDLKLVKVNDKKINTTQLQFAVNYIWCHSPKNLSTEKYKLDYFISFKFLHLGCISGIF